MENVKLSAHLEAMRGGDMTAFEEIYNDLKKPAYTIIVRITRDEMLAQDILQEVFVKLYRSPPGDEVHNPRAYILRIARNLAIDSVKNHYIDASLDEIEDTVSVPEPDVVQRLDIEAALRSLSPADCEVVTLHINAGMKFREIASITETPLGTVLWRYHKAVSELQNKLSGGLS